MLINRLPNSKHVPPPNERDHHGCVQCTLCLRFYSVSSVLFAFDLLKFIFRSEKKRGDDDGGVDVIWSLKTENIKLNWVRAWVFSLHFSFRLLWHCTSTSEIIAQSYRACVCVSEKETDTVSVACMCVLIHTIYFMSHTLYTQFYGYQFIFKINITSHAVHLPI